jgi:hypothetical protein
MGRCLLDCRLTSLSATLDLAMSISEERGASPLIAVPEKTPLWVLQRRWPDSNPTALPQSDTITGNGRLRIRCPRCAWQPRQHDRWSCLCGHQWNTFDTGGVCPECGKLWEQTQCLRCHEWSRHDTWYVWNDENTDPGRKGKAQ